MSVRELERRVEALEKQVHQLQSQQSKEAMAFEWEKTIAKFKNDEHLLASLADAMKLREKERRAVRAGAKKRRAAP